LSKAQTGIFPSRFSPPHLAVLALRPTPVPRTGDGAAGTASVLTLEH